MGKKSLFFLILMLMFLSGCATTPKLSPMQIREITTREIEANYENVYRAALTVIQDNGYIIKNTDMDSGLIVATIDRETSKGSQFFQAPFLGYVANKSTVVELSCMVNRLTEDRQQIRMNIQETNMSQFGGKNVIKQIYSPKVYEALFNDIKVEVKRREAMGR
jgi:hypothetical protein